MSPNKVEHRAFADAIESGDADTVLSMLQRHPVLVDPPSWTPPPIHCAVLWNQRPIVEILLDHGADIEALDPDRQTTPLRYAIMFGKVDVIPLLLARGANPGSIVDGGTTAFQLACEAADGAYEQYDDLPSRESYKSVVMVLTKHGVIA